ncbi:MAG TPA: ABC transporter ATP-binding protein [Candidatus Thermoplasmatota archaeon]|nr:ABC transporter ATP-binding protein [Candidatus Thermoplasmatota archaeon]
MEPAIVARGLTKTFPPKRRTLAELLRRKPRKPPFTALHGIDLEVRRGELFGLLGPNGAGKTTLVKILCTLLLPTSGEAVVAGHDVRRDPGPIRRKVGVVLGGERALYWRLTARENLWYFSQLYDMPGGKARTRIEEVLAEVSLLDRADDRVEDYSKGMKQRLHIARGLLTDPEILLLDEPTIGLDPHAARSLRALVRKLVDDHGRTVVLTTHYLYEADELSDRVGVLHRGRVIALDAPDALKARHAAKGAVLARVRRADPDVEKRLAALPGVQRVTPRSVDGAAEYRLAGLDDPSGVAAAVGPGLLGLQVEQPTLEDVFVSLTGEGLTGEERTAEDEA